MTDYRRSTRRKTSARKIKWPNIIGAVVVLALVFALFNGFLRNFSLGDYFGKSRWDGKSTLSIVLNTKPVSVLIYNNDPKKLYMISLNENANFATGDAEKPILGVSEILDKNSGESLVKVSSLMSRTSVNNYIILKTQKEASKETLEKFFESNASLFSPLRILASGLGNTKETNLTRIDLIRLWWQLKSISVNDLEFIDLSGSGEELVVANGEKVLGVDDAYLNRIFARYLEDRKIVEKKENIVIENTSGFFPSGKLAADFATSVGGRVEGVSSLGEVQDKTKIIVKDKNSLTANYLEKIFDCDINSINSAEEGKIKIILGSDFADKYTF